MRRLPLLPHRPPSASKLGLSLSCVYPWTSDERWPKAEIGAAAAIGNAVGSAGEMAILRVDSALDFRGVEEESASKTWAMIDAVREFLHDHPAEVDIGAEIPLALDLETGKGRLLASRGQRDYSDRRVNELAGTADHIFRDADGLLTVRDWKTGRQAATAEALYNPQLALLALAATSWLDSDEVAVELAHVSEDGVSVDRAELDMFDLADWLERFRELGRRLTSGPSAPTPSNMCVDGFCPLLRVCPATRGALVAVTREDPILAISDDATAIRAFEFLPRAEAMVDAMKAGLREYLSRGVAMAPDGRRLALLEQSRRKIDVSTPERREALSNVLGGTDAIEVVYSTSLESIKAAARKKLAAEGKKRGLGQLVDAAVAAVAEAGGVSVGQYTRPGWIESSEK